MRTQASSHLRGKSGLLVAALAIMTLLSTGCGTPDWKRDVIASFLPFSLPTFIFIPIPIEGPPGPEGPAGEPGMIGAELIIARAVVNADGTLEDSDDITVTHPASPGVYQLTVDLSPVALPAGVTEDDFEVLVSLKEIPPVEEQHAATYTPVSLVGTSLRIDVTILADGGQLRDHAFSVQVLLPAG